MLEHVILVDNQDQMIGTEEKMKAHQQGLLHRAFSVFVYRKKNGVPEILLQQRHPNKYHCGGLWSNTCCSHPREGEEVRDAARRRLKEELALDLPLEWVGSFQYQANFSNGLIEHEYDHVFLGHFSDNLRIELDTEEVSNYRWIPLAQLVIELYEKKDQYTPWLLPALNKILEAECIK